MPEGPTKKLENPERPATQTGHDENAAERKRREARRRLLLGGAAALPVILSVKQANAQATWTQCAELVSEQYPGQWSLLVGPLRDIFGSFAAFPSQCTTEEIIEKAESMKL